jgi:hypothetical protein
MLQIILAIFITFLLIKIAHKFDNQASDIEIIPLVFLPGLFAIVFSFVIIGMSLPAVVGLLTLPTIFLIALVRLRKFELLPWGRAFLYSFLVVLSYIITGVIFNLLF